MKSILSRFLRSGFAAQIAIALLSAGVEAIRRHHARRSAEEPYFHDDGSPWRSY